MLIETYNLGDHTIKPSWKISEKNDFLDSKLENSNLSIGTELRLQH